MISKLGICAYYYKYGRSINTASVGGVLQSCEKKSLNIILSNYVVDVDGTEKVVSISKMKPYTVNKYSRLPQKHKVCQKLKKLRGVKRRKKI